MIHYSQCGSICWDASGNAFQIVQIVAIHECLVEFYTTFAILRTREDRRRKIEQEENDNFKLFAP